MQGYTVVIYIDDIIAIDQSFEECLLTVVETINLFQKLCFVIHADKSKFIPAKIVEYLGFIIDSEKMITYLSVYWYSHIHISRKPVWPTVLQSYVKI